MQATNQPVTYSLFLHHFGPPFDTLRQVHALLFVLHINLSGTRGGLYTSKGSVILSLEHLSAHCMYPRITLGIVITLLMPPDNR